MIVLDFETEAITDQIRPPRPVGLAVYEDNKPPLYMSCGHSSGNTHSFQDISEVLYRIWDTDEELLFHNAKFDLAVAREWFGLSCPRWQRIHDTMFLIFLDSPYASSLALKTSAERILGIAPTEQSNVRSWLISKGLVGSTDADWGKDISKAPVHLVEPYAIGDVIRTKTIFDTLYPRIESHGMLSAYRRECQLLPTLLDAETRGIRIDTEALARDTQVSELWLSYVDDAIREMLGAPSLNLDSPHEFGEALQKAGAVKSWVLTPTGKRSVAKKNLTTDKYVDEEFGHLVTYRDQLHTCLSIFMRPWNEKSQVSGRVHPSWNQVLHNRGGKSSGARTGRLSSSRPNFQNIPRSFERFKHPTALPYLPKLPTLRRYILPEKGHVWLHRDYDQQELRILAHYENAALLAEYKKDDKFDIHTFVKSAISAMLGKDLPREAVKVLNFGAVYGMGLKALAESLNVSLEDAKTVRTAQMTALPGLKELSYAIKRQSSAGLPIKTWGGRRYFVEEPKLIGERIQTFDYKLLNYLIQGSAADCTKQGLINYSENSRNSLFISTVHDEINISCPATEVAAEMEILRTSMEGVGFDVRMLSKGKIGPNWGDLSEYRD